MASLLGRGRHGAGRPPASWVASSRARLSLGAPMSAARPRPAVVPVFSRLFDDGETDAGSDQGAARAPVIALLRAANSPSRSLANTLTPLEHLSDSSEAIRSDTWGDLELDAAPPRFRDDVRSDSPASAFSASTSRPDLGQFSFPRVPPLQSLSGIADLPSLRRAAVRGAAGAPTGDVQPALEPLHAEAASFTRRDSVAAATDSDDAHLLKHRQLQLETEQLSATVKDYCNALDMVIRVGRGSALPAAKRLVVQWFGPLSEAIHAEQARCYARVPGIDRSVYGRHIVLLPPEMLAVITIHHVLNNVLQRGGIATLTSLALEVGKQVETEVSLIKLREDGHKGQWSALNSALKGKQGSALRRNARAALHSDEWTPVAHAKLGIVLITMLCQTARVEVLRDGSLAAVDAAAAEIAAAAAAGAAAAPGTTPATTAASSMVDSEATRPPQPSAAAAASGEVQQQRYSVPGIVLPTIPVRVAARESAPPAAGVDAELSSSSGGVDEPFVVDLDETFIANDPVVSATFGLDPRPWFDYAAAAMSGAAGVSSSSTHPTTAAGHSTIDAAVAAAPLGGASSGGSSPSAVKAAAPSKSKPPIWRAATDAAGVHPWTVSILLSIASAGGVPVPSPATVVYTSAATTSPALGAAIAAVDDDAGVAVTTATAAPAAGLGTSSGSDAADGSSSISKSHKAMLRAAATPILELDRASCASKLTVPAFQHMYMKKGPGATQATGVILIHPRVARLLLEGAEKYAAPTHLPMLVPPLPWTGMRQGGYLQHCAALLRMSPGAHQQIECLHAADMPQVYAALNVLSSTPWKINTFILDVVKRAVAAGGGIADLPPAERLTAPAPPTYAEIAAAESPEGRSALFRRYRTHTRLVYNTNMARHSQQCDLLLKLGVADKFAAEAAIYFPFNMDFRGRVYPIPPHLNHMGNDVCRGVLLFAEGKPLGAAGVRWLKIQLANQMGKDKLPFEDRVAFTEAHLEDVFDSADDPLGGRRWWLEADSPWQALSAIHELTNALRSGDPAAYVCHLPIQLDGSCNGLQHYAALGRDEDGGRAVNLLPPLPPGVVGGNAEQAAGTSAAAQPILERPADVYSTVLKLVLARLQVDAALTDAEIAASAAADAAATTAATAAAAAAASTPASAPAVGSSNCVSDITPTEASKLAATVTGAAASAAAVRQPISRSHAYLVAKGNSLDIQPPSTVQSGPSQPATSPLFPAAADVSSPAAAAVAAVAAAQSTPHTSPPLPPVTDSRAVDVSAMRKAYAALNTDAEVEALRAEHAAAVALRESGGAAPPAPLATVASPDAATAGAAAAATMTSAGEVAASGSGSGTEESSSSSSSSSPPPPPPSVLDVLYVRRLAARFVLGQVDRKVVKQTVMTSVYGVTFFGARDQVLARLKERFPMGSPHLPPGIDVEELEETLFVCASYLARVVLASLGDLFRSADAIKGWLGEACKAVASTGQPMSWITPLGLPVVQPYRRENQFVVRTVLQDIMIADNSEALPVSTMRQRSAFPPNYVHSLDSTHMMLTALDMARRGLTFTAVHDSYWTHAGDVDVMAESLREQFIALYSQPLLENLRKSLVLRFPELKIPALPKRGALQLEAVRDSKYFFS